MGMWIRLIWLRIRNSEHDNEPSYSIKEGEFLDEVSDCHLLKKDSVS
jgi:hypothetical protein